MENNFKAKELPEDTHELLVLLMEECGEVIQACSKVLRFGIDSTIDGHNPAKELKIEMYDLEIIIKQLREYDEFYCNNDKVCAIIKTKLDKLKKYTNYFQK